MTTDVSKPRGRAAPAKRILRCKVCRLPWAPRSANPQTCPNCRSRLWKVGNQLVEYHCEKCGHVWESRLNPRGCPRCFRRFAPAAS